MTPLPPARPHGPRCLVPARFRLSFGAAVGIGLLWPSVLCAAEAPRRSFDIPAGDASATLKQFATQSNEQLLYSPDDVSGVPTQAIRGEFTPLAALAHMLGRTALKARQDEKTRAIAITAPAPSRLPPAPPPSERPSEKSGNSTAKPMTQPAAKSRTVLSFLAGWLAAGPALDAQTAVTPPKDEAVVLSPFTVTSEADQGYAARETLAGTRFKSDLKDVSAQVSVMTKEFLEDIASVTMEDAYRYSANIENLSEFTAVKDSSIINDPSMGMRMRGLVPPGLSHDFFPTHVRQDSYNTERASISSGPNAILFGNGNPGGIVDTALARANLQRAKYAVNFRTDNYNSLRTAIDLNQPVFKDRFALRLAAVTSDENHWRKPGGRKDDRHYGALTFKPWAWTVIRGYYEEAKIDETPVRGVRALDLVTPWIKAGRPAFNNGLTNPDTITAANGLDRIFARNTTVNNALILGAAAARPYVVWGSAATANIALATTPYSAMTIGPGSAPLQTGTDSYLYSLPADESLSPFNISVDGNGLRDVSLGRIRGLSIEQRLPANLFLQVDYNRERAARIVVNALGTPAIKADPNLYLPDRIFPNPNFGRYYVDLSDGFQPTFLKATEGYRAMLSYELDLSQRPNWQKWLGRHRFAGMYSRSDLLQQNQGYRAKVLTPALAPPQDIIDNYNAAALSRFAGRYYLSDPATPATGKDYHVAFPFDPAAGVTTMALPDGNTYLNGWQNPYGGNVAGVTNNSVTLSRLLALQNYLLKDRLVTSFGFRADSQRLATYPGARLSASPTAAFQRIWDMTAPTNWSVFTRGNTTTMGAVAHVLPGASAFYNQSDTWNPPTASINPLDGTIKPGPTGQGKDYGVMLRFWGNRASLRLNKYQNTSGPNVSVTYRTTIISPIQAIEQTLAQQALQGRIPAPPATPHYDPYASSGYNMYSDQVSRGYELELTANPTPHWRIMLNGSRSTTTESNIGPEWRNFIEQRSPVWAQHASIQGPDTATTPIGNRFLGIVQTLNQMKQADGQKADQSREWRANLVTRFSFTEGRLRGAFVGGGYRWRSKAVLGYRFALVDNAFPFPGAPTQLNVPSLNSPIYGDPLKEVEMFLGYGRKLGRKVTWRMQLNIRNLFDDQDPLAQRANLAAGFVTNYNVPNPRSFILTNSFSF